MSNTEEIQQAIDTLGKLRERWLVDSSNPLFATLNATIDPQIAILQGVFTRPAETLDMRPYDLAALDLARTINKVQA